MNREITHIYVGLPERLKDVVLRVAERYRTNPLSLESGGCEIVVEYQTAEVFLYDKVKFPSNYIKAIFCDKFNIKKVELEALNKKEQLYKTREHIVGIYARKSGETSIKDVTPFMEIWNANSQILPWNALGNFEKRISYFTDEDKTVNTSHSGWHQQNKSSLNKHQIAEISDKPNTVYNKCKSGTEQRKQKKSNFLATFEKLTISEKIRTILNSRKPINYYPVFTITTETFKDLSNIERNNFVQLIEKGNCEPWKFALSEFKNPKTIIYPEQSSSVVNQTSINSQSTKLNKRKRIPTNGNLNQLTGAFRTLPLIDKIRIILKSGKPISSYPVLDIPTETFNELSLFECNQLIKMIKKEKSQDWNSTLTQIEEGKKHSLIVWQTS